MKTALISVFDKYNITEFAIFLLNNNYQILSSGGTFKKLKDEIQSPHIHEISSYTNFPEILNGRVKTLHPKIYGGILAKHDNNDHQKQLEEHNINPITLVVCNLYPFKQIVDNPMTTISEAIENIDIGGVTLLRAAAKNYKYVTVITDPTDYQTFITNICNQQINKPIDNKLNMKFALKAFKHVTEYDARITNYFENKILLENNENDILEDDNTIVRVYEKIEKLKYGCNPQQQYAALYKNINHKVYPFNIINGNPGYINILDAIYSYNLVYDLKESLHLPAAASFKHTSPAGAAIFNPLSDTMKQVYNIPKNKELTPLATAFIRARNADPMCSYGDFIALSDEVDEATAKIISIEVSDGIIAPSYTSEALDILRKKKNGQYVILKANTQTISQQSKITEIKELHGITLLQEENTARTISDHFDEENIVTKNKNIPFSAKIDLIVANTALKYTQSNSVAYAKDGQCIGIGAGQQSRIDCVKIAKRKVKTWYLRQHPKMIELFDKFKSGTKRQVKTNAIVQCIEGDFTDIEYKNWLNLFTDLTDHVNILSEEEKDNFITSLDDVSLASDAFFPFRDNIDNAAKIGVKYILQPGGSIADQEVIDACNEYDITMVFTGSKMRMFLH